MKNLEIDLSLSEKKYNWTEWLNFLLAGLDFEIVNWTFYNISQHFESTISGWASKKLHVTNIVHFCEL